MRLPLFIFNPSKTYEKCTSPLPPTAGVKQKPSGTLSQRLFKFTSGRTLQLFAVVRFVHKGISYIAYSCTNKFTNYMYTTFESVFEEVSKSSTDKLYCSSSSLDGGYTDTEVGELRDMESYQIKPKMDEIPAKWRSRRKVSSRL